MRFSLMCNPKRKISKVIFIFILILFSFTILTFSNNPFTYDLKEDALYYNKKKIDPITGLPHFSKENKLSKDKCTAYEICYRVYIFGRKIKRIDHIVNTHVVNHYDFEHTDDKISLEKFYDNQNLVYIKKYFYFENGNLSKIEQYDRNGKDPNGDWIFFNQQGQIIKKERYRDNKLSYLETYKNNKLIESKYFKDGDTFVTQFAENGKVIFEKKHNELEDSKVSTINLNKELIEFSTKNINQIQINNNLNELMIKKKNNDWIVFNTTIKKQNNQNLIDSQSKIYRGDSEKITQIINDIKRLKVFKVLKSKNLKLDQYGISQSQQKIILKSNQNKEYEIIIGNYLETSNAYYVFSSHLKKSIGLILSDRINYILNQDINNFRPKQFLDINISDINSYHFDQYEFLKKEDNWVCQNSKKKNNKQSKIIIETVLKLRALEFIDNAENKKKILNESEKIHSIKIIKAKQSIELEIYKNKSNIYAMSSISDTLYKIPSYVIIFLEKKKKYFE